MNLSKPEMTSSEEKDRGMGNALLTGQGKSHQTILETCQFVPRPKKSQLKNDHSYVKTFQRVGTTAPNTTLMFSFGCFEKTFLSL